MTTGQAFLLLVAEAVLEVADQMEVVLVVELVVLGQAALLQEQALLIVQVEGEDIKVVQAIFLVLPGQQIQETEEEEELLHLAA